MKTTKNIVRRAAVLLLCLAAVMGVMFGGSAYASGAEAAAAVHLQRDDWADDVKQAINDLVDTYGVYSAGYDDTAYAVFDFDNTTVIFDVEEQLAAYQLQSMSFALTPEELPAVLITGLSDPDEDLTALGYGSGSYRDWITDITAAYTALYDAYGPFTPAGADAETRQTMQADEQWQEFAAKMRAMYDLVYEHESASAAYPWITYWFTGMTEQEVYDLAAASHTLYGNVETEQVTWSSPADMDSAVGPVTVTWTAGITVTENIKELWQVLCRNGIDVWVCSASDINAVCAAVDVFGLHDLCTGVIAMTDVMEDGKYVNAYDYKTGVCRCAGEDGTWSRGTAASGAQTQGPGKVTAINNILCAAYGCGPLCGFMDSSGDFNFCTEYDTLKLVVCMNRASRKVTDGGGLIAEVAVYEKDTLHYDLQAANAAGDTLYVLQGRDENGMRTLRDANSTVRFGTAEEKLFCDAENEAQLQYMAAHHMTVAEILDCFAVKTAAADPDNVLGFDYGFLAAYSGYHSA